MSQTSCRDTIWSSPVYCRCIISLIARAILHRAYTEDARINPTNPYAASKAGANALTICYAHTFGLHTTVIRTENNYGIMRHPQMAPGDPSLLP